MVLSRWQTIVGPVATLATVGGILLADRYLFTIPNPGAIYFLAVVFSAYMGGIAAGLVSAAISIGYSAFYFSIPGQPLHFSPDNLARMLVLIVATPAAAVMVGVLQARTNKALQRERRARQVIECANAELVALRSALDQSEVGIVLLDSELRAQFINRAFRRMWRVPDAMADSKPAFVGLMYHGRDTRAYAMPANELDAYVADRVALVRAGDERPIDLRLTNGNVVRFRCKALADGGRVLNYGNVSDLVQQADELEELATVDGLTGIHNRRYFMAQLDGEWSRFRRYWRPLSLLLLDIDLFKSINDRFGHGIGDQILVFVARICQEAKRSSDIIARIGGEEFALLLPETELADACIVAERLREAVAERSVPCGSNNVSCTVSIGAAVAERDMNDPSDLMRRADEALYAAKRAGRNGVSTAPAEKAAPERAAPASTAA